MSRVAQLNLVAYVVALLIAGVAVTWTGGGGSPPTIAASAGGDLRFRRVASVDLLADDVARELIEPDRLISASSWSEGPEAWRQGARTRLSGLTDLEAIIALKPDLVLASTWGADHDKLARLREAGITVIDLGPVGGVASLCANLRRVATELGVPERGERAATRFERRLRQVAAHIPADRPRRRALVLTPVVDVVYGGTTGTSFHDLLVAAGLEDAAAGRFAEPWPRITAEQALAMDPDVVVTRQGGKAELARIPGFAALRATVIELEPNAYNSPAFGILDAAEELCDLAWPR